jgi:hypothetical protein
MPGSYANPDRGSRNACLTGLCCKYADTTVAICSDAEAYLSGQGIVQGDHFLREFVALIQVDHGPGLLVGFLDLDR